MGEAFTITRADGRSNSQVILDMVADQEPGTVFTFAQVAQVLAAGTNRRYSTQSVRNIVTQACRRMLKEQQRTLHNVRCVGYRLAKASDHRGLALARKQRADVQMRLGLATLRNVRWDEMDEQTRAAHEGQLMVASAIWQQMQALERRQSRVEQVLQSVIDGRQTEQKT